MLSVYLIEIGDKTTFYFALIPFGLAITTHYMFTKKHSLNKREHGINLLTQSNERNLEIEGKIMKILITRAWPIFIFGFTLWLLDASFWTIGTLFSEQLKHSSKYGSFFFAAYMIPPIFTSIFATHIYKRFGKKRTAFISAIFSALILLVMAATNNVGYILICVFFVSIFYNLAQILNYSVYEDFVTRLHQYGNDMVAIGQVSASLAYITGPVIFGLISSYIGYQSTFSIVGIILGSVSIACLFVVPRKIKMPQIELKHLTDR
jgi:MFS family permease